MPEIQTHPASSKPSWPKAVLLIISLGPTLLFYFTDSGPYRWLTDIEDKMTGYHSIKLTLVIIAFILMGICGVIMKLCGVPLGSAAKNRPPQK